MGQEYRCQGGPMDGQMLLHRPARGSKGVLLVDKPAGHCWIYEWRPGENVFRVRSADLMEVDTAMRWRAAEETTYDVIAAPWDGGPDGHSG